MHRSFVVSFTAALFVFALAAGAFALWLERLGEAPPEQIVARQADSEDTLLFASGIDGDFYLYKMALFEQLSPRIVVLGSSRAMQVRADFFTESFANLGGGVRTVASLELTVDAMLRAAKRPELVVLLADIWWFNAAYTLEPAADMRRWRRFDPGHLYAAGGALLDNYGRIGMLFPPPADRLGLLGIMGNQGFDRFGSFHYVATVTGQSVVADFRIAATEQRIRDGVDRFEHAQRADPEAVSRFVRAVQQLQEAGMQVVLLFPPFTARANALMGEVGGYGYVADLFGELRQRGLQPLDYHDLLPLQQGVRNPDCEFIDGFHGGDVAYARVILDAVEHDARLREYVDLPFLNAFIEANSGAAQGERRFLRSLPEVDFLGLGCARDEVN